MGTSKKTFSQLTCGDTIYHIGQYGIIERVEFVGIKQIGVEGIMELTYTYTNGDFVNVVIITEEEYNCYYSDILNLTTNYEKACILSAIRHYWSNRLIRLKYYKKHEEKERFRKEIR